MTTMQYIYISLDIFCILVDLIILLCITTSEYRNEKLSRIFIGVITCNIFTMATDIVSCTLDGNSGTTTYYVLRVGYFITFTIGPILLMFFSYYILTLVATKTVISKTAIYVTYAAVVSCALDIIFIIVAQFNDMYYIIDASNSFQSLDMIWLTNTFSLICIVLNTSIIIAYRKVFERREMFFLFSYAMLPAVAVVLTAKIYGTFIFYTTTLTILIFYAGIQSEQSKKLKQNDLELINSRIDIMLSQIQPHFLYNSLTAISGLCSIDPERAEEALNDFSHYLRKNLDSLGNAYLIPFENELEHIEHYFKLEKMRFEDKINVVYNLSVKNFVIPPLTVQPLAENAIRYGITKKPDGGTLTITTNETKDHIVITVSDDGLGFAYNAAPSNTRRHVGIENVRTRLQSQLGGTLTIESKIDEGTICTITLPKSKMPAQ